MSDAGRLGGFALVLSLALVAGLGIGALVGPVDGSPQDSGVVEPGTMPADHG